jgi:glycosyltransferase involved in cell wall biosynthesis
VPRCRAVVILNGLRPEEYAPVKPASAARDLLYLGMFRDLKGTDVFLSAIAQLEKRHQRHVTAYLIGQADADFPRYQNLARALDIAARIEFHSPKPTRAAFALAHAIVVPSRAESMPYVVLEAIAAGLPIVATRVGGIPEIFGPRADELVAPGDADALASAIERLLADPSGAQKGAAERRDWLRQRFSINVMQKAIEGLYREILAAKTAHTLGRLQHKMA